MPLYRRLPKRGFTNINSKEIVGINVSVLERFENDSVVSVETLLETGVIKNPQDGVKILGNGESEHRHVQLRTSEHRSMYSYVRLSIDRCTATYV